MMCFFCSVTVILLHCGSFCHENKFLACVNIPANKAHSDSDYTVNSVFKTGFCDSVCIFNIAEIICYNNIILKKYNIISAVKRLID